MALIQTVSPENAEGKVKEIYDMMMERARVIPKPFQMMSASPELLAIVHQSIGYYFRHPRLSFGLLTHIRMLVADHHNYGYCTDFNTGLLQMLTDATDEQLDAVKKDPAKAALDDKDRAMLL
ncbi:MAG: hypothetical protein AB7S75_18335 [Desulfococcaceae bacterium]